MSAKQCLRHEWLRGAPTQASAHLRKYLSKSREVLLERVVSRENLRRAALLSQTANGQQQQLSQSEMCLHRGFAGSRGSLSLPGCDDYEAASRDTGSSRASLADSVSSSKSSLAASQSCLLNKEQTQGLLSQAQDRSSLRASMAQGLNRVSLFSRIRSLNQVQSRSQACLNADEDQSRLQCCNGLECGSYFDGSREKLYGLKSLSKSQGMLDIYRSLESLQRHKRDQLHRKERSKTEDALPFARPMAHGSSTASLDSASSSRSAIRDFEDVARVTDGEPVKQSKNISEPEMTTNKSKTTTTTTIARACEDDERRKQTPIINCEAIDDGSNQSGNNENLCQSVATAQEIKSTGPSSLTVSEANLDSLQSLESDTLTDDSEETNASRSLTNKQSSAGSECHGRETDSETEEPKYTVAQLVSAFNKHQEVASRSSLESIMSERRVADDSNNFPIGAKALRLFIPDIDISEHKPLVRRKTSYKPRKNWEELRKQNEKNEGLLSKDFFNDSGNEEDVGEATAEEELPQHDTRIDDKYKQCVEGAKLTGTPPPASPVSLDSGVNLTRDILQKPESPGGASGGKREALEKLRERTAITRLMVGDGLASKISAFADKRPSKSPTRPESRSRTIAKEKLCTGSYGRAMEKFSGKSKLEKQQPRSRRTVAREP